MTRPTPCCATSARVFRAAATPSAPRGRRVGRPIARATWATWFATSNRRPRTFRDRTTARRGCTGLAVHATRWAIVAGATRALSADDRRLSQHLLRTAGRSGAQGAASGRSAASNLVFLQTAAQPASDEDRFPPTEGDHPDPAGARLVRAGGQRARVCAREVGRFARPSRRRIAWANKQMAASESGTRQFALARGSITLIKRAYPQFMAGGGEQLPREILTTIFPLSYWDLIRKYSARAGPRSVPGRGVDGAGVDVRAGHQVARRRLRLDADDAVDRTPVRAQDEAAVFDAAADDPRDERPDGDGATSRTRSASSAACTWRSPATTPARRPSAGGCANDRICPRTSSSTTSRIRRRSSM